MIHQDKVTRRKFMLEHGWSSAYATHVLFLTESPSIDAGEITDKGYINQRAVLEHMPRHYRRQSS
jgi:feruloyl-CoA synthase